MRVLKMYLGNFIHIFIPIYSFYLCMLQLLLYMYITSGLIKEVCVLFFSKTIAQIDSKIENKCLNTFVQ